MAPDDDPIFEALAGLAAISPDTEWESRVLARCHSTISKRKALRRANRNLRRTTLAAISSAAILFLYLAVSFAEALRLATHP